MLKGNLKFVEYLGDYLVEGMYEKTQEGLENYKKYLDDFNNVLTQFNEADQKEFKEGLRNILLILLNHPEKFQLNSWFNNTVLHYLKNDSEVHQLLSLIWSYFFQNQNWDKIEIKNQSFEVENIEIRF